MKNIIIFPLLALAAMAVPSHAVTVDFRNAPWGSFHDLGDVLVGQTVDIRVLLPENTTSVSPQPLSDCNREDVVFVSCYRRDVYWWGDVYDSAVDAAFLSAQELCTNVVGNCFGYRLTSTFDIDYISFAQYYYIGGFGKDANGTEYEIWADSEYNDRYSISYKPVASVTPVPLPASLPLLAAGFGLFGVLRKLRKGQYSP